MATCARPSAGECRRPPAGERGPPPPGTRGSLGGRCPGTRDGGCRRGGPGRPGGDPGEAPHGGPHPSIRDRPVAPHPAEPSSRSPVGQRGDPHGPERPHRGRGPPGGRPAAGGRLGQRAGRPTSDRDAVFLPFQRGAVTSGDGVGVGLHLVARFAEALGGRAWVDEHPGGGARFCIDIPVGA
ncbi:MAG: sensor histidine kinase [Acidimicrobiales bacterium]|nr:sensor histidine kinase [Acidimicrobiales bacterium]